MSAMLKEIEKIQGETLQQEAVRELHDEIHAARVELEKREREYRYKITIECLRAIGYASEAGSAPGAAEAYLDDALRCLQDAKQYAILLGELPL